VADVVRADASDPQQQCLEIYAGSAPKDNAPHRRMRAVSLIFGNRREHATIASSRLTKASPTRARGCFAGSKSAKGLAVPAAAFGEMRARSWRW
jgi:hypothetical protein